MILIHFKKHLVSGNLNYLDRISFFSLWYTAWYVFMKVMYFLGEGEPPMSSGGASDTVEWICWKLLDVKKEETRHYFVRKKYFKMVTRESVSLCFTKIIFFLQKK